MRARKSACSVGPWMIRCLAGGAGLLVLGCQAVLPPDADQAARPMVTVVSAMPTRPQRERATPDIGYPAQAPARQTSASPPATATLRPTSTPVPTRTPTASPTYSPFGEVISRFDVTGDGQPEVIARIAKSVVVFAPALGDDGKAVELARAPDPSQIIDLDEDGDYEILTPDGTNRWQTLRWDGGAFVDGEAVVDPPAPTPAPVIRDALPPLPADLFFERDGQILRWPRTGGSIEAVWPRPGAFAAEGGWQWEPETAIFGPGLRRRWQVSADGRKLAVVERQDPPAGWQPDPWGLDYSALPRRFRLIDLATGVETSVTASGRILDLFLYEGWQLSSDGRELAYLAYGEPVRQPGEPNGAPLYPDHPAPAEVMAVDLTAPDRAVRLATCDVHTHTLPSPGDVVHGTSGCMGLSFAPDGRRVAYTNGQGLWVVGMPDATGVVAEPPRMVAVHDYGAEEAAEHSLHPAQWSPDGARLLAVQAYYEGSDWAIVDLATGEVGTVPNSTEWSNLGVALAWLPGGQAVINARYGDALGQGGLTRVDSSDVSQVTPLLGEFRVTESWQVVGPKVMADGAVRFGLRQAVPELYRSDGVFEVGADGRGWRRLASLPPRPVPTDDFYYPDHFLWSPDGSAFLAVADDPQWTPVSGSAWLGLENGARVWDAGEVLRGARWLRWVGADTGGR